MRAIACVICLSSHAMAGLDNGAQRRTTNAMCNLQLAIVKLRFILREE